MTDTIQRQYNDVIASYYDLDPQSVTSQTLQRASEQIQKQQLLNSAGKLLKVYDVGMGTGLFLSRLREMTDEPIQLFGIDLAEKMLECAYQKIPDLIAAVDTAENLERHFSEVSFDLICTHFITGFVPLEVLAPKVYSRLEEGGYWSYLGATRSAYPTLQKMANNRALRWLTGSGRLDVGSKVHSPADRQEVLDTMERHGFVVRECETFQPKLQFANLDEFLDFAYYGGWLTPFIEQIGLHKARAFTRFVLNRFFFPAEDHHCIEIHLAQKVSR